jgi:hypothetical protein
MPKKILAWLLGLSLLAAAAAAQTPAPAPSEAQVQLRVLELIRLIEDKPNGVVVNEQVKVITEPDRPAFHPDGTRNQDFTVRPDTEHPALAGIVHEEENRERSGRELIRIGQPAVPALVRALTNEGYEFRPLYARVLGEIGDLRAAPSLLKYYEDGRNQLKVAQAAASLDPALAADAEKKGNAKKQAAVAALETLSGQKLGDEPAQWQAWWESQKDKVQPLPVPVHYSANPPEASSPR